MEISGVEIILYVRDQEASAGFYSEVLQKKPVLHVPGMTEFELQPGVKLGLMPEYGIARIITPVLEHPSKGAGIPRCELYLLVENADNAFLLAAAAGAKVVSAVADRDWGHRVGYLADADGHVIALAHLIR